MQKERDCANFIFNRVGLQYEAELHHQPQLIFSQILLGSLFIRGYRISVKNAEYKCCIFYKRNNFLTEYLYLKFVEEADTDKCKWGAKDIYSSIKIIDDMKQTQQLSYKVIFAYLNEKCYSELDKLQFTSYVNNEQEFKLQRIDWSKEIQSDQEKMVVTSKDELIKLKELVWTYINTFGNKYKNNYYCDLQKRNQTSFIIEKLINTVNWIIYCETVDKPYNQIETANWTCFQKRAKEKLKPDRKDILLTGSARSMMIHLLLLEKIDNYKKEYQHEVGEVICEFRKSYIEGEVKAYEISDQLDTHNLIYKLKSVTIQHFNTV